MRQRDTASLLSIAAKSSFNSKSFWTDTGVQAGTVVVVGAATVAGTIACGPACGAGAGALTAGGVAFAKARYIDNRSTKAAATAGVVNAAAALLQAKLDRALLDRAGRAPSRPPARVDESGRAASAQAGITATAVRVIATSRATTVQIARASVSARGSVRIQTTTVTISGTLRNSRR